MRVALRNVAVNGHHILRDWPDMNELPPRIPIQQALPLSRARARYSEALDAEQLAHNVLEKRQMVMGMYEDLASNFFIPAMFRLAFVSSAWGFDMSFGYWMEQALAFGHPFCYLFAHARKQSVVDTSAGFAMLRDYVRSAVFGLLGYKAGESEDGYWPIPERERKVLAQLPTEANERQDCPAIIYIYAWFIEHGLLDPQEGDTVVSLYQRAAGRDVRVDSFSKEKFSVCVGVSTL